MRVRDYLKDETAARGFQKGILDREYEDIIEWMNRARTAYNKGTLKQSFQMLKEIQKELKKLQLRVKAQF